MCGKTFFTFRKIFVIITRNKSIGKIIIESEAHIKGEAVGLQPQKTPKISKTKIYRTVLF